MDTSLLWNNSCDPSCQPEPVYHLRGSVYIYIYIVEQHLQHHLSSHNCCTMSWLSIPGVWWWVACCGMSHVHTVCWIGDTVDSCLHTTVSGAGQWHHHHRQKIPVIIISLNILWLVSLWCWCVTHWLMGGSHSAQVKGRLEGIWPSG